MIDVYPTKFEAVSEYNEVLFKVEMLDSACATIKIISGVNATEWDTLYPLIRQCLIDMKLEGDNETKSP